MQEKLEAAEVESFNAKELFDKYEAEYTKEKKARDTVLEGRKTKERDEEDKALKQAIADYDKWVKDLAAIEKEKGKSHADYTNKKTEKSTVDTKKTWEEVKNHLQGEWDKNEAQRKKDKDAADL